MTSPTVQRRRRRRVLALATAGLALCIGVSITSLAAWQQSINVTPGANGIGASLLQLQLSLDGGTTWNDVDLSSSNAITFSGAPTLLTPNDTTYASVLLRAARGSRGASVTLNGGSVGNALINVLRYTAKTNLSFTQCNDGTSYANPSLGDTLVAASSVLTAGTASPAFTVPSATSGAPGSAVGVCLALTLPSTVTSAVSGLTASPVWQFVATSN